MHQISKPTASPAAALDTISTWRRARLLLAGVEAATAEALARDGSVDLHALLELIDRGCPPHLAARILAPLDVEGRVG